MKLKITKNLFYNRNEKNKEKKNLQYCAILNKFSLIFLLLSFVSTTQQIQKNISTNIQQSLLTTNWNKKQIIPLNNFKKQNNQNQFWWLTTKEGRKEKIKIISNNSFRERKENSKNINNIFNKKLSKNNIRRAEQKIKSENENYLNLKSLALNELDIKSDEVLYKMMKRTTLTTKEYSSKEEIPTTQIPSLKPINLNGLSPPPPPLSPQLPSLLLTFPGLPIPQQIPTSLPQSQNKQPEQYEQLGCGWDFLSQSCKDLFRVGWCQNCFDFGNQIMHDCRCVKVTNFYIQTTSFLGSSAASERANSAISSSLLSNKNIIINISTSPKPPSFGLPLPLPEFQQIQPSSPSTDSKYPNNILPPPQQFHPSPQFPPPALFQSNNNSPQQIFFPQNSEFVTNIIPIGLPNFAENSQKELFINQRQ